MTYNIIAKYIKNINFDIPDSKSYFLIEKKISNYKINFDIKSKKIKDDILEIDTNLKLISKVSDSFIVYELKSSIYQIIEKLNSFIGSKNRFSKYSRAIIKLNLNKN